MLAGIVLVIALSQRSKCLEQEAAQPLVQRRVGGSYYSDICTATVIMWQSESGNNIEGALARTVLNCNWLLTPSWSASVPEIRLYDKSR